jgi:hypothetical protein
MKLNNPDTLNANSLPSGRIASAQALESNRDFEEIG